MTTVVNKILLEISSYVTASAIAFAIDFCLLAALVSFAGVPYLAAAAISFAAGTVFVYWASVTRIFDFRRIGNPPREFGIFLAIGIVRQFDDAALDEADLSLVVLQALDVLQ